MFLNSNIESLCYCYLPRNGVVFSLTSYNIVSSKPDMTYITYKPIRPLRKSRSYGVGDEVRLDVRGRKERLPSSGSGSGNKALSDRFSTFSPAKGIQKSESDTDIHNRRWLYLFYIINIYKTTEVLHYDQYILRVTKIK